MPLSSIESLGWLVDPTPVERLPALQDELGLAYLGAKRDDLCNYLYGGTKVRKLNYLLADPMFADAAGWHALGAIGSGQLVALCAAAQALDQRLFAHCFWEPPGPQVLENLAFVASGPSTLRYHHSRAWLVCREPGLLLRQHYQGAPVIAPGASNERGLVGLVAAGLELAQQIHSGELPRPDRIYLPFGTGGIAVGLSIGLALAGVRTQIHAVAVVERLLSTRARLRRLQRRLLRWLHARGVAGAHACEPVPVVIDHSQLGRAYGVPSAASEEACVRARAHGLALEPIYSGKAMAGLLADAVRAGSSVSGSRSKRSTGSRILFWLTPHRPGLPCSENWKERLPPALASRLERPQAKRMLRRGIIAAAGVGAGGVWLGVRLSGYPSRPGWQGRVLSASEAHIVECIADALLLPAPGGAPLRPLVARADQMLATLPDATQREMHRCLAFVEHGTPLRFRLARLTALEPTARERFLSWLAAQEGLLRFAYQAVRQLCLMAYYQAPESWPALQYGGPWVALPGPQTPPAAGTGRARWSAYERWMAPVGTLPRAAAR